MRFAFVIYRYFPHGGLQKDFVRILREALERGHHVCVLAAQMEAPLPAPDGVEVHVLPVSGFGNHGKMKSFESAVHAFLAKNSFDRVLMFNRISGGDFYFAADNCLAATYAKRWDASLLRWLPRYRSFLALEKSIFAAGAKTKILTVVPTQIKEYRDFYGTPQERFFLLPPGVDPDFRRAADGEEIRKAVFAEFSFPENAVLLIQAAAKFHVKGVDRSLYALASLAPGLRKKCRFLVAGGDDPAPFIRLSRSLGIEDTVVFAGARDDMPRLIEAADLMIHPARNEAAGTVITEALAMGIPVVASKACGFASFAAEIDEKLVTPEPFRQKAFDETLLFALENLAGLQQKARTLCTGRDFYRRAEIAVDLLEK